MDVSPPAALVRTLRADPAEIPLLSVAILRWALAQGLPYSAVAPMNLVLEELVMNIVTHGYERRERDGVVEVQLASDGGHLIAVLRDRAPAFDPLAAAAPDLQAPVGDRPVGGLGLHLVRRLAHDISYRRVDGCNELRIVRRMPQRPLR